MKLQIPEPCHENWNKMTPSEKGRFCGSCQKEVTDFTKMTKTEIKQFFLQKTSEVICGRFENRQIEAFNLLEIKTNKFNLKPWWIAAATFFMFVKQGYSQGLTHSAYKEAVINQTNSLPKIESIKQVDSNRKKFILKGNLYDSLNQETIAIATVKIKNTKTGCHSDFDGNFNLEFNSVLNDSVGIEISSVGFETKTFDILLTEREINLDTINLKPRPKIIHDKDEIKTIHTVGKIKISEAIIPESTIKEEKKSTVKISGIILDEVGDSMPFVNILIVGTEFGASSDINGKFELNVHPEQQENLKLQISSVGYTPFELNFVEIKKDTNIGVIEFKEQDSLIKGCTFGEIVEPTLTQRFFGGIRGFFYRLFH